MGSPPQQGERRAGRRRGCGAAGEAATPETAGAKRAEGDPHACRNEGASDRRGPARAAAGEACGAGRAQCRTAEGAGPGRRRFNHRHPPRGDGGGSNLPGPGRRAGLARGPCSSWWCGCESGASQGRRAVLARDPWPAVRVRPWLPPAGGRGGRIHIRSWPAGGVCPLATQDRRGGIGKAGSGWRRAVFARGQTAYRGWRLPPLQRCGRGRIAADRYRDVPPAD